MIEALQQAVNSALNSDANFSGAVTGIYDKPPQDGDSGRFAAFPYAVIGDMNVDPWPTDDWSGSEVTFDVQVFSRSGGNREASQILDFARAALDRADLSVAGYRAVTCDFDGFTGVHMDTDGETRDGLMTFRVLLCP